MPRRKDRVRLEFSPKLLGKKPETVTELSSVERVGDDLWLGADEGIALERLTRIGPNRYAEHATVPLDECLELPAGRDHEIDIEGLAYSEPYLWVTGSHSLTRKKPKGRNLAKDIDRLATMERETNRFLLARLPLVPGEDGRLGPVRQALDPADPRRQLTAARLFGTGRTNLLVDALAEDPHLGRFLRMPAKENGFDIEGLAVSGRSLFLGLRGPVLRGWAVILQIQPVELSAEYLTLEPFGKKKTDLYRKHFLDLRGLGIRELCLLDEDLLVLAGPTMDVPGPLMLFRWPEAVRVKKQQILTEDDLALVADLSQGERRQPGHDQPEGICLLPDGDLLVVHDSPAKDRMPRKHIVEGDRVRVDRRKKYRERRTQS